MNIIEVLWELSHLILSFCAIQTTFSGFTYQVNWNSERLSNLTSHMASEWEDWHLKLNCLTLKLFYFPLKSSNKFTFLVTSERNSWYVLVPKLLHLSFNLWILKSERYWDSIFSFFPYKKNIEEANPLYESMEKEPTNYKPVWGKHESENLERPYFSINS